MSKPESAPLAVDAPVRRDVAEPAPTARIQLPPDTRIASVEAAGVPRGPRRRRAVLVCHGMGQQVPFQNIDLLAGALEKPGAKRAAPAGGEPAPRVGFARLGDEWLPRAELTLKAETGEATEVHVYEAYWAPLTEGRVSAFAVTRFLVGAGLRGLRSVLSRPFDRWMFGRLQTFRLTALDALWLVLALVVVASVLALYAALGTLLALRAADLLIGPLSGPAWDLGALLEQQLLRSPLVIPVFAAVPALGWIVGGWLGGKLPGATGRWGKWVLRAAGLLTALGWLATTEVVPDGAAAVLEIAPLAVLESIPLAGDARWVLAGGVLGVLVAACVGCAMVLPGRWILPAIFGTLSFVIGVWVVASGSLVTIDVVRMALGYRIDVQASSTTKPLPMLLFLACATAACIWLRSLYIQYLGDVAVYLSSHQLNAFHEIRARIREVGYRTACAIYGARNESGSGWEYDEIVVVGHSLGSVVAYDTLNAVLNEDRLRGGTLRAEERTRALVTFGSPLDKSAFIFRTQMADSRFREALAAAVQPLIQPVPRKEGERERGRTIPWFNVHSPFDPISGPLDYYDPPKGEEPEGHRRIQNEPDPDGGIFGYAHVTYWKNPALIDYLRTELSAPALREARERAAANG